MKKIVLFLICLFASGLFFIVSAQTQQGVVKTKGRMVNGKHVAGQGLSGATVTIQGRNAVQSQTNGGFSFPILNKTFMLQGVQKQGYQLVDPDATRKAYQYSPNTFYIVMETPDQQSEDQLAAERKIRRTLQRQLQQREDELEELKAQNKLTQEEYRKAMQQLYDDQQNNEKLIADMAKEYAEMDYDQMDELNRQISDAILNGELTKADSLLRTKGDVNSRIAEVRKAQRAEAQEEAELAQRQENLAASKEGTKKKLEDLAQDCKNYFERFKMANQHDSAAYYIELRAELDTTKAEWQFDAAYYLEFQNHYKKAGINYKRALEIYRRLAQENPQTYEPDVASTLNNLANLYSDTQRFSESEDMYKEALAIRRRLAESNPHAYELGVAMTLYNLANMYSDTQRFSEAESMYNEALDICRQLAKDNPQAYEQDVTRVLNGLANLYYFTQRFSEAETIHQEALEIRRRLAKDNPQAYEPDVANTLNNLALLYKKTQRFSEAETMCKEALEIRRHLVASNPKAYEPAVSMTLINLADLYKNTKHFSEAETMYNEALGISRSLAKDNPAAYELYVAKSLNSFATLYSDTQRFSEAETMYKEALEIYRRLAKDNPQTYEPDVAATLNSLANLYNNTQRSAELESVYKELRQLYTQKTNREYKQGLKESAEKSYIYVVVNNKRLIDLNFEAHIYDYIQSLSNYVLLAAENKHFSEAYQTNKTYFLPIYKKMLDINPEDYRERYSKQVGAQAFYAIFVKQYAEAEQYAREGLQVDSTKHFIYSNLAAALLFQGKYADAEKIYRQFKDELKEGFLDDFKRWAEVGVIPKEYETDVEKIKKMLNEK